MKSKTDSTRYIPAVRLQEGAGVIVHRAIGTSVLRNYDPFVMLDYFGSEQPEEYIAGFPAHPHRGFSAFSYMIDGHMEHEDSMGNRGKLEPGSAQLMKAASGIIHSEMPMQNSGQMRGFQLWINLPAINKMERPEYQAYEPSAFPVIETQDYRLKLLMGHFASVDAPIVDDITKVSYFDVQVGGGNRFQHALPEGNNHFLYLFEGTAQLKKQAISEHTLVTLGSNESVLDLVAGAQGARFILVSGRPINESVVQYGPFVMNSKKEIDQALQDFQSNNFVRERAWIKER